MTEVDWPLSQASLGSSFDLKEQQECFLIGNNDSEEFSIKFGVVTNLVINRGECHSHAFQTSFDRTGGSSGSPVFNAQGVVVGIHMRGTDTTSIELRIEYLKDVLMQIQDGKGKNIVRGSIGVELDLFRISSAIKHMEYPREVVDELKTHWPDIKHVLSVDRTVPGGRVEQILRPGDIIHALNGELIGNNLYMFDRLIDANTSQEVELVVWRNGQKMTFSVKVENAEVSKVRKFVLFAGGVFHDLTPALCSRFMITGQGVFLNQVNMGSCLSDLGEGTTKHPTSFVVMIEEICGMPTRTLDDFIDAVNKIGTVKKHINVLSRNLRAFSSALLVSCISLDLKFEPLRIFEWDSNALEWIETSNTDISGSDDVSESMTATTASTVENSTTLHLASVEIDSLQPSITLDRRMVLDKLLSPRSALATAGPTSPRAPPLIDPNAALETSRSHALSYSSSSSSDAEESSSSLQEKSHHNAGNDSSSE